MSTTSTAVVCTVFVDSIFKDTTFHKIKVKGVPENCELLNEMSYSITRNVLELNKKSFVYMGRITESVDRKSSLVGIQKIRPRSSNA